MKNLVCSLLVFLQVVVSERVDLDGVCADQNLLAMEFFHLTEHHEEEAIIYDMRKGKYRVKKKDQSQCQLQKVFSFYIQCSPSIIWNDN